MASHSKPYEAQFPVIAELRCGVCFKKLGIAELAYLEGEVSLLCTRRSRQRTCRTLNIYEGTPDGTFRHSFKQLKDGESNDR